MPTPDYVGDGSFECTDDGHFKTTAPK
jgi:hypothetical protein